MRSVNGNILVYGNVGMYTGLPYAAEYGINLNLIWKQLYETDYSLMSNSCTLSPDGGYLFAGYKTFNVGLIGYGNLFLIKTNNSGDTLWTKLFATQERLFSNSIVTLTNGNYCLSYTYSKNSGNMDAGILQTYIMELNEVGDSLNSARIDMASQIYNSALVPLDNGGVYALMNSKQTSNPFGFFSGTSKQNNSSSVILNASLTAHSGGFFQSQTNEIFGAACKTSDGSIACSGLIQPYGKSYYKPALLIDKQ
jgi:hypothetical protein